MSLSSSAGTMNHEHFLCRFIYRFLIHNTSYKNPSTRALSDLLAFQVVILFSNRRNKRCLFFFTQMQIEFQDNNSILELCFQN
jgi:hypothetical protein